MFKNVVGQTLPEEQCYDRGVVWMQLATSMWQVVHFFPQQQVLQYHVLHPLYLMCVSEDAIGRKDFHSSARRVTVTCQENVLKSRLRFRDAFYSRLCMQMY